MKWLFFWDFLRLKASWYGVLYQGVGWNCWCFESQLVVTQICCILLQVMATNVMGPALLTKAFFFWQVENWLKKALEFHLWQPLAHIQWWILGMFNKIKHWYYKTVLHGSAWFYPLQKRMDEILAPWAEGFVQKGFLNRDEAHKCWWHSIQNTIGFCKITLFCRIDLRMLTVNLWWNRKQALYPQLRAASKEEPSKVQLPVRISAYLNMCNSVTSTKICLWACRCFGVFFIPSDSNKITINIYKHNIYSSCFNLWRSFKSTWASRWWQWVQVWHPSAPIRLEVGTPTVLPKQLWTPAASEFVCGLSFDVVWNVISHSV